MSIVKKPLYLFSFPISIIYWILLLNSPMPFLIIGENEILPNSYSEYQGETEISFSMDTLYYNCSNQVKISGISEDSLQFVSFKATNSNVIYNPGNNKLSIIPNVKEKIELTLLYKGDPLLVHPFYVRDIPEPKITLVNKFNNRFDQLETIEASDVEKFTIVIIPNEDFARDAPYDKLYTIKLGRILSSVTYDRIFMGNVVPLSNFESGDMEIIIEQLTRKRYDGTIEKQPLSKSSFKFQIIKK